MPEKKKTENQELVDKLKSVEETIKENLILRKKQSMVTRVGMVLISLFILIFVTRGYNFAKNYDSKTLIDKVTVNSKDLLKPELEKFMKNFQKDMLPEIKTQLADALKKETPKYKEDLNVLTENIIKYSENKISVGLVDKIAVNIESHSKEIEQAYPGFFKDDIFEKQIEGSKEYIVDGVTDLLEWKIAKVNSSLHSLKTSINSLEKTTKLDDEDMKNNAEANLIEALLETMIYNLNPEKGSKILK